MEGSVRPFQLTQEIFLVALSEWAEELANGIGVRVVSRENENFFQIEKLNREIHPRITAGTAVVVQKHLQESGVLGYIDKVCSTETSGPKYSIPLSIALDLRHFSIHQYNRGNLVDPIYVESYSPSRNEPTRLWMDRAVSRGSKVVYLDDITRSYRTIRDSLELLRKGDAEARAIYSIFLWDFVPHPQIDDVPLEIYHPLFIVRNISPEGRLDFDPSSLAFKYIPR